MVYDHAKKLKKIAIFKLVYLAQTDQRPVFKYLSSTQISTKKKQNTKLSIFGIFKLKDFHATYTFHFANFIMNQSKNNLTTVRVSWQKFKQFLSNKEKYEVRGKRQQRNNYACIFF